ncbi:MAG: hypothetical protein ABIQ35_05420 [Verrucomicrobiota bacterium]
MALALLFTAPDIVNTANPFQLPPCLQRADQRRRERIKAIFFVIIAAHVVLFTGLLFQGCQSKPAALSASADGYPPVLLANLKAQANK